jgi:hypothetical protein
MGWKIREDYLTDAKGINKIVRRTFMTILWKLFQNLPMMNYENKI